MTDQQVDQPQVAHTTAFTIVQELDGQVVLITKTGLPVLRDATMLDVQMLSQMVSEAVKAQSVGDGAPSPADAIQQRLQERADGR